MALRIGRIPYLHAEPLYFAMARLGMTVCDRGPGAMARAAVNGEIDAGPVPVMQCAHLQDHFEPVAAFCLASVQPAGSSLLCSTRPLTALAGAHIGVPETAVTSLQLLHILLRLKYQLPPAAYVPLQTTHDAFLLIGNAALRQRKGAPEFPYTYDLGAEWHDWTGLPLVWSRWLVRKDVSAAEKARLAEALYLGLEDGVEALCQIARPRQDVLMLPREVVTYIHSFRYYMGRAEQQALAQFQGYLQQLDDVLQLPGEQATT